MEKKCIEIKKKHRNLVKKVMYIADERRYKNCVNKGMLPLSLNSKMGG